jgi:hypothetical protein
VGSFWTNSIFDASNFAPNLSINQQTESTLFSLVTVKPSNLGHFEFLYLFSTKGDFGTKQKNYLKKMSRITLKT